jgi:predicted CopG family antitoxin
VPSKNISLTEEVYKMLSRLRLDGESFSDAVRRLAERGSLVECAGLWADLPDDEYTAIRRGMSEARASLNESVRRRVEAS